MAGATVAVNDETFAAEVTQSTGLTLVDFWATWCGPCQRIGPLLEELATELAGKAKIVKMEMEDSGDTAAEFGVRSIPCLILFKNGQEVERVVGAKSKSELRSWLESHV